MDETLLSDLKDRSGRLLAVRVQEQRKQLERHVGELKARAAANGAFHSSRLSQQIYEAHERELEVRSIIAWECIVRAHKALGSVTFSGLTTFLKELLTDQVKEFQSELSARLAEHAKILSFPPSFDLSEAAKRAVEKHDIEIDLYQDVLMTNGKETAAAQYNFYGYVGAVQTGASAQANVVQSLGAQDLAALGHALELARGAIQDASDLDEAKKRELISIAQECKTEISSGDPNNTKALTMLNVLAASVQSIASAQPAYQALRAALIPLGVVLP